MVNDRIADMLTRIRNANQMKYDKVTVLSSKTNIEIARILKELVNLVFVFMLNIMNFQEY